MLLTNLTDAVIAIRVAEQIREGIGQCHSIEGQEVRITASIRLAGYPANGERYEMLLGRADASKYWDKARRLGPDCGSGTSVRLHTVGDCGII